MAITIDNLGIDMPPPFDTIEDDILDIFTDFKADILQKLIDVFNDIRTVGDNGLDNILTLMLIPNSLVQIVSKPFVDFIAILNSYTIEWNDVGQGIANVVFQFLSGMYLLRATVLITPPMLQTIVKTSVDMTLATIIRVTDPRIFKNIQGVYVGNIYRMFDTIGSSMGNALAMQTASLESFKYNSRQNIDVFTDVIESKFVIIGVVYAIFIYACAYWISKRYRD